MSQPNKMTAWLFTALSVATVSLGLGSCFLPTTYVPPVPTVIEEPTVVDEPTTTPAPTTKKPGKKRPVVTKKQPKKTTPVAQAPASTCVWIIPGLLWTGDCKR